MHQLLFFGLLVGVITGFLPWWLLFAAFFIAPWGGHKGFCGPSAMFIDEGDGRKEKPKREYFETADGDMLQVRESTD